MNKDLMSEETLEGLSKQDEAILENVPYSDYNINKFTNLCLRILNLKSANYSKNNSLYKKYLLIYERKEKKGLPTEES